MTPSSLPSYTFLDPTPSPLLNNLASAPIPPPTYETTQLNNTAIPNAEPNTPYGPTPQGPTPTDPSPSPQSTLPTSIAHNHASGLSTSAHQTSQLPPQNFDFPNPQPNTENVHEPPRTHPMITRSQSGIVMPHELDFITVAAIPHCLSINRIIGSLNNEFDMTDLGAFKYFLGNYANHTPTESKLGPEGAPVQDPTLFRSLAEGLQYLTFTRPNLSYAVQQICLYTHDPGEPHLATLKRILRYVQGLPPVIVSFWVITYYLGPLNDNTLFHAPVPKLNTGVLLTL
ncbi:ribonuclease H-like domain-containing protein [Tanacetum coccineum]